MGLLLGKDLLGIDAAQEFGIGRNEAQEGRFFMVVMEAEVAAPIGQGLEGRQVFVFVAQAGHIVTAPVDDDFSGTHRIGFFGQ